MSTDRRRHKRVPADYAVSFLGNGITGTGVLANLSFGGCEVRCNNTLSRGELLKVLIDVPRYETPLQVDLGPVRWSNAQAFGLEFSGAPADDYRRLRELLRATEAANGRTDRRSSSGGGITPPTGAAATDRSTDHGRDCVDR